MRLFLEEEKKISSRIKPDLAGEGATLLLLEQLLDFAAVTSIAAGLHRAPLCKQRSNLGSSCAFFFHQQRMKPVKRGESPRRVSPSACFGSSFPFLLEGLCLCVCVFFSPSPGGVYFSFPLSFSSFFTWLQHAACVCV